METTGQVRGKACDQSWFLGKSLGCEKVQGRFVICHRKKWIAGKRKKDMHDKSRVSALQSISWQLQHLMYLKKKKNTEKIPPTASKLREPFTSHPLPVLICRFSPHPSWLEVLLTGGRERGQESIFVLYVYSKKISDGSWLHKAPLPRHHVWKNWS